MCHIYAGLSGKNQNFKYAPEQKRQLEKQSCDILDRNLSTIKTGMRFHAKAWDAGDLIILDT